MKLRNVVALYLVRLRSRIGQELLALVGISVGVGLLFAALVANSSLTGTFERQTDLIVGDAQFQVAARGSATLPERLLDETRAIAGVARVAALLQARGDISGPRGRASIMLLGVTPELGEISGSFSKGFSYEFLANVRAVAVPTPLADALGLVIAQPVTLALNDRVVRPRLGAKLQRSDVGAALDSPVMLAPLRYAQELTNEQGRVNRLVVEADPGAEASVRAGLERLVGDGADVRPAKFEAAMLRKAAEPTTQSIAMFSVFGAMVGFLFAFSAALLTVPQRRRLILDLQFEGYRSSAAVKVLLFDALALGALGSLLGVTLGDQVARRLFDDAPSFLQYAFPVGPSRTIAPRDFVIAVAGGLLASVVAVLAPMTRLLVPGRRRQTVGTPSTGGRHRSGWQFATALVFLAGGVAAVVAAPASAALAIAGLVALTVAMLLSLPSLLAASVVGVDLVTRRVASVVPFIAMFDLRDRATRVRSLAVAATGAVAVFGSVALQGAHADLERGLDHTTADVVSIGDVWALVPGKANLLVTTPFAVPPLPATIDGIERVRVYRGGFLDIGDRRVSVFGPPAAGPMPLSSTQILDGDLERATARLRAGGWVVVSKGLAREQDLQIGDLFEVPSPAPVSLRVAALSTNLGWPPGAIVMNAEDYRRAWGSADASALLATARPGTSAAAARRSLAAALEGRGALSVMTAEQRQAEQRAATRAALDRLAQISRLVLLSAIIAMASVMGGLIWQRRTFLAGVKIDGYGTAQMWKALVLEAAVLIGTGCLLGGLVGLLGQSLLSRALTSVTGFPVEHSVAFSGAILTSIIVTTSAVVVVAAFGHRAASIAPERGLTV